MAAAGTVSLHPQVQSFMARGYPVKVYDLRIVSDADGNVKETSFDLPPGAIERVEVYEAAAPEAPTDKFNLKLLTGLGMDVLAGQALLLDATKSPHGFTVSQGLHRGGPVYPTADSMGDSKAARILIFLA